MLFEWSEFNSIAAATAATTKCASVFDKVKSHGKSHTCRFVVYSSPAKPTYSRRNTLLFRCRLFSALENEICTHIRANAHTHTVIWLAHKTCGMEHTSSKNFCPLYALKRIQDNRYAYVMRSCNRRSHVRSCICRRIHGTWVCMRVREKKNNTWWNEWK